VFTAGHTVGSYPGAIVATSGAVSGSTAVSVTAGTADAMHSILAPTSASIAANGTSTQVLTVTAKDSNGNLITTGGATVTITRSSGSGTISPVIDNGDGTYTVIVTSATAVGRGVFVATLGGNPVKNGAASQTMATIIYVTGTATQVRVETAADGSGTVVSAQNVDSGNSIMIYAISRDADNNFVANVSGSWSLVNKTGKVANSDLVTNEDRKGAVFTGHIVGTAAIHVISAGLVPTDSETLTVLAGAVSELSVSGYPSPITAGSTGSIMVTAKDAFGNAAAYTGMVHFTSSDTQAVLPPNYTFDSGDNGTHSFVVTVKTAGIQSIIAADIVINNIVGSQNGIIVNSAVASLFNVETAADGRGNVLSARNVAVGNSITFYAVTRDQYGNFVANVAASWSLVNRTGGVANSDIVPAEDGKSAVFTAHLLGAAAIHVTSGGMSYTDLQSLAVTQAPATFALSDLVISPPELYSGQSLKISVMIANTGGTTGIYQAVLRMDGTIIATKNVNLESKTRVNVIFNEPQAAIGRHVVEIGTLAGTFEDRTPQSFVPLKRTRNVWIVWIIICIPVALLSFIAAVAVSRRRIRTQF
jgi:hypothetical protein